MGLKRNYHLEVSFTIRYKVKVAGNSRDIFSDAEYQAKRMLLDDYGLDFDKHKLDIHPIRHLLLATYKMVRLLLY